MHASSILPWMWIVNCSGDGDCETVDDLSYHLLGFSEYPAIQNQRRIQNFPNGGGGAPTPVFGAKTYHLTIVLPITASKWKKKLDQGPPRDMCPLDLLMSTNKTRPNIGWNLWMNLMFFAERILRFGGGLILWGWFQLVKSEVHNSDQFW